MIKIGETGINSVYYGSIDISKIYNGTNIVYQKYVGTDWTKIDWILPTLKVGDELSAPTAYGISSIIFGIVHKKQLDTPDEFGNTHIAYLMTNDVLRDSSGNAISVKWGQYGNNYYHDSNVHQYLSGTFPDLFLYNKEIGTTEYTQSYAFLSSIDEYDVPYREKYNVKSKFWLPSAIELCAEGYEDSFRYDNEGFKFDAFPTGYQKEERIRGHLYYWTRSASMYRSGNYVWAIGQYGWLDLGMRPDEYYHITPCIAIRYRDTTD